MSGLPFGAAQSVTVPSELRTYEHVVGIEFIELDPNLVYPRSAAYRKTETGAQMRTRDAAPEIVDFDLTIDEARALIEDLADAGFFDWQRVYKPVQGTFVVTATDWRVSVTFDEPLSRHARAFESEGEDEFPDTYDQVMRLLVVDAAREGHGEEEGS